MLAMPRARAAPAPRGSSSKDLSAPGTPKRSSRPSASASKASRGGAAQSSPSRAAHRRESPAAATRRAAAELLATLRSLAPAAGAAAPAPSSDAVHRVVLPNGAEEALPWLPAARLMAFVGMDEAARAPARGSHALAEVLGEMATALDPACPQGKPAAQRKQRESWQRRFNAAAAELPPPDAAEPLSNVVVKALLEDAYTQAVTSPGSLNKYKPFSNEVYGETNFEFVEHLAQHAALTANDVFYDLGSGVGQVVLQVAAQVGCEARGIELQTIPAGYAPSLQREFAAMASKWRPTSLNVQLMQGSFLEGAAAEGLGDGDVLFCNNYAFDALLNSLLLRQIEAVAKSGAIVITYKPLWQGKTRSTGSSSLRLTEFFRGQYPEQGCDEQAVSWTSQPIQFIKYRVD